MPHAVSVERSLSKARALEKRGAFGEAHKLYAELAEKYPTNHRARDGLRTLRTVDLTAPKRDRELELGLAKIMSLREAKRLDEACATAVDLAERYDNVMRTHFALGLTQMDCARYQAASEAFATAIKRQPTYAPAYKELGNALRAMGESETAAEAYAHAVEFDPTDFASLNNLGATLFELSRLGEALSVLERAIAIAPRAAGPQLNRALVLSAIHRYGEAHECLLKAVELDPSSALAHSQLGNVLVALGRHDAALAAHEKAVSLEPEAATLHNNLAVTLSDLGRLDEAAASFRTALKHDGDAAHIHHNLSGALRYTPDEPHLAELASLAERPLPPLQAAYVRFALGKAHEDLGDTEAAFQHFRAGNALRHRARPFDAGRLDAQAEALKALPCGPLGDRASPFATTEGAEEPTGVRPIFIVGLPRSGTSLVEQILASHGAVHGAGELHYLEQAIAEARIPLSGATTSAPDAAKLSAVRKRYLAGLADHRSERPIMTDKMPANFRFIGLIAAALPEAKIVHVERHPAAVCWSLYKHAFGGNGHDYASDLDGLARYHAFYRTMMEHYQARLPGLIHTVRYERLTADLEAETHRLLAYCDLPFEPACLQFHRTERAVRTASLAQVRQPLYQGSSNAYRAYAPHIAPLLAGLAGAIEAYGPVD